MKKLLVMAAIGLTIAACSKKTAAPGASKEKTPEQTAFETTCSKCHGLKNPASRTAAEWVPVVDKMQKKGHFDDNTKTQILSYLTAHAKTN